ncbi:MAG: VTT domain-containing protein [Oscillospiraceae bacterium]|nr:VTT domain-containing protein [Oscillospiraceae bacterium]
MDKKSRLKAAALCLLFLALIAGLSALLFPYLARLREPEFQAQVQAWVESAGFWGLLAVFGVQVLQVFIAFIPGEPVEILAGALYGTLGGFFLCAAGCALASSVIFLITKRFGKSLLYKLFGEETIESWSWLHSDSRRDLVVFIVFFIPGTPKDLLTYVAGITPMSLGRFLAISNLARLPSVISSTIVGATMREGDWLTSLIVFAVTGVVGILGILFKDRVIEYCRSLAQPGRDRE